jgi:hypothetical protein
MNGTLSFFYPAGANPGTAKLVIELMEVKYTNRK